MNDASHGARDKCHVTCYERETKSTVIRERSTSGIPEIRMALDRMQILCRSTDARNEYKYKYALLCYSKTQDEWTIINANDGGRHARQYQYVADLKGGQSSVRSITPFESMGKDISGSHLNSLLTDSPVRCRHASSLACMSSICCWENICP